VGKVQAGKFVIHRMHVGDMSGGELRFGKACI
jgi:hypothetical protein